MKWTTLSAPSGVGGGWPKGQSIATVSIIVTINVRGMSRYLRIPWDLSGRLDKGKYALWMAAFAVSWKATLDRGFGAFYKLKIKVVLGITNQKIAYRLYK